MLAPRNITSLESPNRGTAASKKEGVALFFAHRPPRQRSLSPITRPRRERLPLQRQESTPGAPSERPRPCLRSEKHPSSHHPRGLPRCMRKSHLNSLDKLHGRELPRTTSGAQTHPNLPELVSCGMIRPSLDQATCRSAAHPLGNSSLSASRFIWLLCSCGRQTFLFSMHSVAPALPWFRGQMVWPAPTYTILDLHYLKLCIKYRLWRRSRGEELQTRHASIIGLPGGWRKCCRNVSFTQ